MSTKTAASESTLTARHWQLGTILACAVIGLIVSFILSLDEIQLMQHPTTLLSCSVNLVLNCSTVMQSWQAHVFGFPNMLLGLMAFPVFITVAVIALSGVQLPRLLWRLAYIGFIFDIAFAYWLFFNSLYAIQVLCPWCLVITFTSTIMFAASTRFMLRERIFAVGARIQRLLDKDIDKLIVASWVVILVALVYFKFGSALFV